MVATSLTAAGVICPGFGLVLDQPPGGDTPTATPHRDDDLTMALDDDPLSVKSARDHTAAVLTAWGLAGHAPSATLVVSELVTNALRHALPAAEVAGRRPILLRLVRRGRDVMCLVGDPSERPPVLTEADFAAETGRGLHLVAAHSRRWDWTRRRCKRGKWVWALLLPPPDGSP